MNSDIQSNLYLSSVEPASCHDVTARPDNHPWHSGKPSHSAERVLQINGLKHSWNKDYVLFEIPELSWFKEQVIWLKGENGTGKSTLMRLMAGLEPVQQGSVFFSDIKPSLFRSSGRGRVCYLHQTPYLFAGTVQQNLQFVIRSLPFARRRKAEQRLTEGRQMAALHHLNDQVATTLSGGERQRLALLRAWLLQPDILFLDEPAANLDDGSVELICMMVKDLIQQGTAVMLSSHQSCALTQLTNQSWLLKNGTVYAL
ncbi:ATP-binding cassette domain-containing protein [Oceanospirillum sediminis]|uniref:Energy-coupling factor ABC transporter ATP-binding protein n=1 Tax=Oceanospirillum sediminis TaxID=2760088 RepID=A0A839IXE4_9GAMM|nr:energy-coupling factor ABC transporter ATP-binding protein [Oceanospirillum sediminis]MBB1489047.1 energy-coupling factor ABC transporter ATP-binding protein [Oceanospirillum sediminis]